MINEHLLQKFCADKEWGRGVDEPFTRHAFTYATNGHIIVRVPRMEMVAEGERNSPNAALLPWDHEQLTVWHPMPEYTLPEKITCPQCARTHYVSYCPKCDELRPSGFSCPRCKKHLCDDREVCTRCDWQGRAYADVAFRVSINVAQVNGHYLELIKSLPGPWSFALDPRKPRTGTIRFKFNEGVGLLMPMLPNEGRIS